MAGRGDGCLPGRGENLPVGPTGRMEPAGRDKTTAGSPPGPSHDRRPRYRTTNCSRPATNPQRFRRERAGSAFGRLSQEVSMPTEEPPAQDISGPDEDRAKSHFAVESVDGPLPAHLARSGWCWRMSLRRTHNGRSPPGDNLLGQAASLIAAASSPAQGSAAPTAASPGTASRPARASGRSSPAVP